MPDRSEPFKPSRIEVARPNSALICHKLINKEQQCVGRREYYPQLSQIGHCSSCIISNLKRILDCKVIGMTNTLPGTTITASLPKGPLVFKLRKKELHGVRERMIE